MKYRYEDRIVFFASGEFPVATLEYLIKHNYNIVGIVTSRYKNQFKDRQTKNIVDIAKENNIDYIIPNDVNSEETVAWLKEKDADVFCVISYKKLSDEIIRIPKKIAFNVHGSLLPDLRGAAPINWAIRYGFKQTGLTAFVLSNVIDAGKILEQDYIDIKDDDTFESLFWKMSDACPKLVGNVIYNVYCDCSGYKSSAKGQYISEYDKKAPKITEEYGKNWTELRADEVVNLARSVYPVDGLYLSICSFCDNCQLHKEYKGKIYKVSKVSDDFYSDKKFVTDGKNYLYVQVADNQYVSVEEIQLSGKKRMNIKQFLCGYEKILLDNRYTVMLVDF